MVEKKPTVRVCIDLPVEKHKFIKDYNETHTRQLNITKVCLMAIDAEIEQIKKEQAEND